VWGVEGKTTGRSAVLMLKVFQVISREPIRVIVDPDYAESAIPIGTKISISLDAPEPMVIELKPYKATTLEKTPQGWKVLE